MSHQGSKSEGQIVINVTLQPSEVGIGGFRGDVFCVLGMATCTAALPESLLDVLRSGTLTEEQARMIYEHGREAVVFALLVQAKRIAAQ
jgi:hypothetical protein